MDDKNFPQIPVTPKSKSKRWIILVFIFFVVVALATGAWYFVVKNNSSANESAVFKSQFPKTSQVDPKSLQPFFPIDLPIEKNAKVLESFYVTNLTNVQSVRTYKSQNTVEKNYADYLDYFNKYSWTISVQDQKQFLAKLKAVGPDKISNLQVTISGGSEKAKQVIISLISTLLTNGARTSTSTSLNLKK